MTTSALGAGLSLRGSEPACDGRVEVFRWSFAPTAVRDLARELGRAYIKDKQQMLNPGAPVAPRLPTEGHASRSGDLGEVLAAGLYNRRLGAHVPFRKLVLKPQGNATVQGADLLALTLTNPSEIEPVTVEVKAREKPSPSEILNDMAASIETVDEDYLRAAWVTGVQLMQDHPDYERHFAMSAAHYLARTQEPDRRQQPHARHAVCVVGRDNLSVSKIEEHWDFPPVTELHVIQVPDFADLRDRIFEAAAELTYGDLADQAPTVLPDVSLTPGVTAPVSSTEATAMAATADPGTYAVVLEAALWYLADWDGLGLARSHAGRKSEDVLVRGLCQLLSGAEGGAAATLADTALTAFANSARDAMRLDAEPEALAAATSECAAELEDEALALAVRYVGAAIRHRLPRHPRTMVVNQGSTGPTVRHVVDNWTRVGMSALWPPQAKAVEGGLFDKRQRSLAIKLPTSAGKTALIELLAADALDDGQDAAVVVLGPTKALVSQLTSDLRSDLPKEVDLLTSHGGLDYDIDGPAAAEVVAGKVTVMTPERFDLEWRRAATGDDNADVTSLGLLIVDEAHLINDNTRGASLELSIARALRDDVRVVLLSSQFSDLDQISEWLKGRKIESTWRPTWLDRNVYTRNEDETQGWLCDESGHCERIFDLKPSKRSEGDGVPRKPVSEAAELVARQAGDGLVVVYTNQKRYIGKLVEEVHERLGDLPDDDERQERLDELAAAVEPSHEDVAKYLHAGIGLHHGDLSRSARTAVETAARQKNLRCVVCTPTLLEGVDFPARSVIAAYPPEHRGQPQIARLRSLAGRAGRGGLFPSGQFTVRTKDVTKAKKWLRAFQAQLPPTTSGLTAALRELMNATHRLGDLGAVDESVDSLLLQVFAEGAVADGDLRERLEEALNRTLWYSVTHPNEQNRTFRNAVGRAQHVFQAAGNQDVGRAFYRSGLPLAGCLRLRDVILSDLPHLVTKLDDRHTDFDDLLLDLATVVAPHVGPSLNWHDLDTAKLRGVLSLWLDGTPTSDIEEQYPETWEKMLGNPLENLLPWVLTGVIEIIAALADQPALRDRAHERLGLSRVRYGVPNDALCRLVREGYDRVAVVEHSRTYRQSTNPFALVPTMEQYVRGRLDAEDDGETEDAERDGAPS